MGRSGGGGRIWGEAVISGKEMGTGDRGQARMAPMMIGEPLRKEEHTVNELHQKDWLAGGVSAVVFSADGKICSMIPRFSLLYTKRIWSSVYFGWLLASECYGIVFSNGRLKGDQMTLFVLCPFHVQPITLAIAY